MAGVSPADGPVAVTGASGYIGSWIVRDLAEQGYEVRACVRDASRPEKVDHLKAMNEAGLRGSVALAEGDLGKPGSYDDAFAGCSAVIHAGRGGGLQQGDAPGGVRRLFHRESSTSGVASSAGTVKRFVFTSSFAPSGIPRPEGYVFTEKDWCGDNVEAYKVRWTERTSRRTATSPTRWPRPTPKDDLRAAEHGGFEAMAILPLHVIGPLMCANHDQGWSWQNCIRFMMEGKAYKKNRRAGACSGTTSTCGTWPARIGFAPRARCAGTAHATFCRPSDRSGELVTWELQARLPSCSRGSARLAAKRWRTASPPADLRLAAFLLPARQAGARPRADQRGRIDPRDGRFVPEAGPD